MVLFSLSLVLAVLPSVFSLQIRAKRFNIFSTADEVGDDSADLTSYHDIMYIANITLGGTQYPVQIDTGSSDLWINGTMPNIQETDSMINLTYASGWAYGKLSYTDAEFSGIQVPNQAFIHATNTNALQLRYGADGILGLGFTALSNIDDAQSKNNNYTGRSLLYRMFEANSSQPNFIAFALRRLEDPDPDVEGVFSIGEIAPEFADVQNLSPIPLFPESNSARWNVLIEAIMVGQNVTIPTSKVDGAPSNTAVALLDTGTSYTYVPTEIAAALYSGISGAYYDSTSGYWKVPCDAEVDVAIQIGGQILPLHPLDVTPNDLRDSKTCIGSFIPQPVSVDEDPFDWLIGDNVLRAMYSLYDFGDYDEHGNMGNPFVKLLPIIDPDEASQDFAKKRGTTAKKGITYGSAVSQAASSSGSTTVTLSKQVAQSLNLLGTMLPAIIAIMALNALVVFGAFIFAIWYCCFKRRGKKARVPTRTNRGRLTPMPVDARHSYVPGGSVHDQEAGPAEHTYQPVSMAMTEDTLMPMTPTFPKFGDSKIIPGDRPRSMAVPLRMPRESESTIAQDEPFLPPSPAFHQDNARLRPGAGQNMVNRPNSVA